MNPYDLTGPEFLGLYLPVLVAALVLAPLLRCLLRAPGASAGNATFDLDWLETAYLAGGEKLAVEAAFARLVCDGVLAPRGSVPRVRDKAKLADDAGALERAVLAGTGDPRANATLSAQTDDALAEVHARLERLGLVVPADRRGLATLAPQLLLVAAVAAGVVKLVIGLVRDRPVGFLVLAIGVALALGWPLVGKPVVASRRGSRVLRTLSRTNAGLRLQARNAPSGLEPADAALAVALWGPAAFAEVIWAPGERERRGVGTDPGATCGGGCGGGSGCGGCGGCGS